MEDRPARFFFFFLKELLTAASGERAGTVHLLKVGELCENRNPMV